MKLKGGCAASRNNPDIYKMAWRYFQRHSRDYSNKVSLLVITMKDSGGSKPKHGTFPRPIDSFSYEHFSSSV